MRAVLYEKVKDLNKLNLTKEELQELRQFFASKTGISDPASCGGCARKWAKLYRNYYIKDFLDEEGTDIDPEDGPIPPKLEELDPEDEDQIGAGEESQYISDERTMYDNMRVEDLKAELDMRNIEYGSREVKPSLIQKLVESDKK